MKRRGFFGALAGLAAAAFGGRKVYRDTWTGLPERGAPWPPRRVYDMAYVRRHGPIEVYDRDGNRLEKTRRVDVQTGEITRLVWSDGRPVLNATRDAVLEETVFVPAPLRVIRKGASC